MNSTFKSLLLAVATFFTSCNGCQKIPANQWVLNSGNYGKDWEVLNKDATVPACNMPGCYNLYLPATTMVGGLVSKQRVGGTIKDSKTGGESAKGKFTFTYMWEIVDPLKFIRNAKELSKGGEYLTDASLEGIENKLIDKKIHDVAGPILDRYSPRNFEVADFEKEFNPALNASMEEYGVLITGMGIVHEWGAQMEAAIDNANAIDFYKSIDEEELGREYIKASASAPKIIINVNKDGETNEQQ